MTLLSLRNFWNRYGWNSSPSHTFQALFLSNLKTLKNFHTPSKLLELSTCSKHAKMHLLRFDGHSFFFMKMTSILMTSDMTPQLPHPTVRVNHILSEGGGHYGLPTKNPSATVKRSKLYLANFLTLFLLIFAKSHKVSFGFCFLKKWKEWTSNIFEGSLSIRQKCTEIEYFCFSQTFSQTKPISVSEIWILHVLSFHLGVYNISKTQPF